MRGRRRRRPLRRPHPAAYPAAGHDRRDVLQPRHRRHRQGAPRPRDRRARWPDGPRRRRCGNPLQAAEPQQGARRPRTSRPGGPQALPRRDPVAPAGDAEPDDLRRLGRGAVPRCGERASPASSPLPAAASPPARSSSPPAPSSGARSTSATSACPPAAPARRRRSAWPSALRHLGLPLGRMKTGTPPRLDGRTIDWASLEAQPGDDPPEPLSFMTERIANRQVACAITATTPATHAIIRENLHRSAAYGGGIAGRGPRYCPSVEDKVVRFAERERHQVFLEPEGLDDHTVYPNGISTSLPEEVQARLVASIPGLERARILRPGYAIEYDHVDPRCLDPNLEVRSAAGLVPGRPDQRHHGLRGSGRAGDHGRAERRASRRRRSPRPGAGPGGSLYRRAGGRPGPAGRHRALSHVDRALRISPHAAGRQCRVPAGHARRRLGLRRRAHARRPRAHTWPQLQALAGACERGGRFALAIRRPRRAYQPGRTMAHRLRGAGPRLRARRRRRGHVPVAAPPQALGS